MSFRELGEAILLGWAKNPLQKITVNLGVDWVVQQLGKKLLLELICVLERLDVKLGMLLYFLHHAF